MHHFYNNHLYSPACKYNYVIKLIVDFWSLSTTPPLPHAENFPFHVRNMYKYYLVKVLHNLSFHRRILFILHPQFLDLLSCIIYIEPSNLQRSMAYNIIEIEFKQSNGGRLNYIIPRSPPPSSSHIFCNASRSRRLFSSFGTPSEGVISPTIAIQRNQKNILVIRDMLKRDLYYSTIKMYKAMLVRQSSNKFRRSFSWTQPNASTFPGALYPNTFTSCIILNSIFFSQRLLHKHQKPNQTRPEYSHQKHILKVQGSAYISNNNKVLE